MPKGKRLHLKRGEPCVCGANDWIHTNAYGVAYRGGYAVCGHCGRSTMLRDQVEGKASGHDSEAEGA